MYVYFTNRCRRDIISKHFTEVWKEAHCKNMCDRCYHKEKVNPRQMDISQHCLDLHAILDNTGSTDKKVTGKQLIDAWYVFLNV